MIRQIVGAKRCGCAPLICLGWGGWGVVFERQKKVLVQVVAIYCSYQCAVVIVVVALL